MRYHRDALTDSQQTQLRAGTLFSEDLPVPVSTLEAVGLAAGVADRAALNRLMGLGLVDDWGKMNGAEHAAVNPMARPLAGDKLTEAEQEHLATDAIGPLAEAWRDTDGDLPLDPRSVEAARLALMSDAPVEVLDSRGASSRGLLVPPSARHEKGIGGDGNRPGADRAAGRIATAPIPAACLELRGAHWRDRAADCPAAEGTGA